MAKTTRGVAVVVVVALTAGVAWWAMPRGPRPADGPIILISIDTLRADRLPAYGYTRIRTPQIDRLAADAILFDQAYAHSPQTLPSHVSILTGRLPFEHGVRDNIGFQVKPGERMLQHLLHERGFATGAFVSAYVLRHQLGINQGFDVFDDELPPAAADRPLGQVQRAGHDTAEAAIRWVDQQASPRFFLFFHIYEPHLPYTPPERFGAADPYDGEVAYSDEIVGRLIDRLRVKDLYDRATIVLLSDHGEGLGDHGEDEHGIFLYRATIHVPLIVKLPGARRAGTRVPAAVQHIDLVPTLLDLVGGEVPRELRGRSLRPLLDGSGQPARAAIYSESLSPRYHYGWSELYALSDGRYRFIRAPRDELYDIVQDPAERRSIAAERPELRAGMRKALEALIAGTRPSRPSAITLEDRRKLGALGYVGIQSGTVITLPGDQLPDPKDKVRVLQKFRRAMRLAGEQKAFEAIALYRELLAEDPAMTDVWLQLGEIYSRQGMTAAAVESYKEVIKRKPDDAAALTGAAAALLRLGRLDEARAHAELAVAVAPAHAHELLARIAIERGDAAEARRQAALAQAADATLPSPDIAEGLLLYKQGRYGEALPRFLAAKQAMNGRTVQIPDVSYYIADCLARLERYAEAEPYFQAELALSPSHVRARAGLAMLYRAMGRDADSDAAVEALVRHAPTPEGYATAAQLWTMFGEPGRAAAARAQAARLRR